MADGIRAAGPMNGRNVATVVIKVLIHIFDVRAKN